MFLEGVTPESLIDVDSEVITTPQWLLIMISVEVLQQFSKNSLMKMMVTMKKQRKWHQNDR